MLREGEVSIPSLLLPRLIASRVVLDSRLAVFVRQTVFAGT